MTTQAEPRRMIESRRMKETRKMKETREMREIDDEMKMIEKTNEKQFRNNPDAISTTDEKD
jgi:hypothetical protein